MMLSFREYGWDICVTVQTVKGWSRVKYFFEKMYWSLIKLELNNCVRKILNLTPPNL